MCIFHCRTFWQGLSTWPLSIIITWSTQQNVWLVKVCPVPLVNWLGKNNSADHQHRQGIISLLFAPAWIRLCVWVCVCLCDWLPFTDCCWLSLVREEEREAAVWAEKLLLKRCMSLRWNRSRRGCACVSPQLDRLLSPLNTCDATAWSLTGEVKCQMQLASGLTVTAHFVNSFNLLAQLHLSIGKPFYASCLLV